MEHKTINTSGKFFYIAIIVIGILFMFYVLCFKFQISVVNAQAPSSITLNLSVFEVAPGSLFEVRVLASSEDEINALNIVLEYSSELFSFERSSTSGSVVSLWKSLPFSGEESGIINLIGGSTIPWTGKNNEIITLMFKARREGTASFVIRSARLALADGLGTQIELSPMSQRMVVSKNAPLALSEIPIAPPQIAGTSIINDPQTNNPLIVLNSSDIGSIKWLGVRSRSWIFWSDWEKTQLVAEVPKYAWVVQFKALGFDGSETEKNLYRWDIFAVKFFFLAFVVLMLVLIWGKFKLKINAE